MNVYYDSNGTSFGPEWWLTHGSGWWSFPSYARPDLCVFTANYADTTHYAPPPSETLRALIEVSAPWYVVLDRFVEEYPQWEEVLTWAPTASER